MQPYRILILSDERPGHFNLADGIAAALERLRPSETVRHVVRRGRWSGAVLASLTRLPISPEGMLSRIYRQRETAFPPCDIIVSAGAETLAANIWLARARGVPNIYYGSLRSFRPTDFSLVLTSYIRNAGLPRHALALKPSRLDPDTAPRGDQPGSGHPRLFALLIGGPSAEVSYTRREWDNLLTLMANTSREHDVRWLVANSRRTPAEISDRLATVEVQASCGIESYLDVRSAGPGTLGPLLARSHAVLCTADSSSMISECVWSRRPSLSLLPDQVNFTADESAYRNWLASSLWCAEHPLSDTSTAKLLDAIGALRPITSNPLLDLAKLLKDRLPPAIGSNSKTPHAAA